jgi:uncharacterized protein
MDVRVKGLTVAAAVMLWLVPAMAQGPAFDCAKAQGEVEQLICKDAALAALDRKLDGVYKAASAKAREMLSTLRTEQRGWVSGRNECWKATNADNAMYLTASWTATSVRACVEAQYRMRIAELQALYQLVTPKTVTFACQNNPANAIVGDFFDTDPPTARLERGDRVVTVYQVRAASGAKYEGQNVEFWTKGQEASVSWMNPATGETEKLQCKVRP